MNDYALQILLVENDKHDYRLIKRTLEKSDLSNQLTWAQYGEEALRLVLGVSFDIILVDYQLPDMTGLALLEHIRQKANAPVIFVTGQGNEYVAVKAMKKGIQDYIVKDGSGDYLQLLCSVINKTHEQWLDRQAHLQAKIDLETARLAREEHYRLQAELARVEVAISQPNELEHLLHQITAMITEVLPATGGASIILWNAESQAFVTSASTVPNQTPELSALRVRRRSGATRWIVENRLPLTVSDVNDDPFQANAMLHEHGLRAYAGVPVLAGDEVLGVLYALDTSPRHYQASELNFLQALAGRAAIAITKVRLYEELRSANQQLQYQSEELRNYARELEQQNSELDAFTHTVAHDLKSPLGLILGYADLLENAPAVAQDEALSKITAVITRSSHRMGNIIDELLLLARVRQEDVQMEPILMNVAVAEAQGRLLHLIDQYQPDLEIPAQWELAMGHGPWIEEVWANYLSNGLKYGGTPPRLTLGSTLQANGMVRFWIKDNGAGIPPEDQEKLFTPFTQLNQVRTSGHGLGLSIVRRIVEKCGGHAGVESDVGQGSLFWFTLPAFSSDNE